jgi:crotonobetainyl-CoA:carnitine CoA-transferase CaiB-like acyl-CoA transferase
MTRETAPDVRPLLAGVTVIACEHAVAGPFATRQLADLGARVIKIERPGAGDFARRYDQTVRGVSSHFVWLNRSKQSVTANIKTEAGQRILTELLARADVFVQNLAPGALSRLGLSSSVLRERYPRLVVCEISGYGSSGPWQSRKAYDLLVQAEAGLIGVTGSPDQPAKAGIAVADIAAGMYAFSGILAALFQRERTGNGAVIEVSLLDSLAEWMGYPFYYARYGGTPPSRTGASHATIAPYGPFTTRDAKTLLLAIQNEDEWQALCTRVLRRPDWARDPRLCTNSLRVTNRALTDQLVSEGIRQLTLGEALELCEAARIAYGQVNDVGTLEHHPQLMARHRWTQIGSPVGKLTSMLPPIVVQDMQPSMADIPAVGEHSKLVLLELGYSKDDIRALYEAGVV